MSYVQRLESLSSQCFAIEKDLKMFDSTSGANNNEQDLRRSLYSIRCDINALKRYAEMVDKPEELLYK